MFQPGTDNEALHELRDIVRDLNKSTKTNSLVMGAFTFILVIIALYEFIELITIQIPFVKLQAQLEIRKVIESCKINSGGNWFDQNGNTHKCSEMPKEWFSANKN